MKTKILIYITLLLVSIESFAQVDRSKVPEPGPAPKIIYFKQWLKSLCGGAPQITPSGFFFNFR
jgi:hypothetical protein